MEIEQYARTHNFVYIAVKEIRKHRSNVLPFTVLGKTMMVKLPAQITAEVQEMCEQETFDHLLMSTKAGMAFDPEGMHWIPETEDAFAWFATHHDQRIKTALRVIAHSGTPRPSG